MLPLLLSLPKSRKMPLLPKKKLLALRPKDSSLRRLQLKRQLALKLSELHLSKRKPAWLPKLHSSKLKESLPKRLLRRLLV